MRIRAARKAELETLVAELWAPLAAEMAERSAFDGLAADARERTLASKRDRFEDEAVRTLVAADGDRLVGYVTAAIVSPPPIFTRDAERRIEERYVREGARRRGIATDLISAVQSWAAERGCDTMSVGVHPSNTAAKRLYEARCMERERETYRTRAAAGESPS